MRISYKHFLYGAITFTSVLAALMKIGVFRTPTSGPREFLFGFLDLAFLAWAIGQLWVIRSREQQQETDREEGGVSLPMREEDRPSEDTLASAELYLSLGESLDTVCLFVKPEYRDWDASQKQVFRRNLKAALEERRANAPAPTAISAQPLPADQDQSGSGEPLPGPSK